MPNQHAHPMAGGHDDRRSRAVRLHQQGWQTKDIAVALGVTQEAVGHWLNPHQPPADLSFEEWIDYVFDNPPDYNWFDVLGDWGACPPPVLVEYITRLFEQAAVVLKPFSNAQLNQGLWFIAGSGSDALHVLFDETVPWPARQHCLRSIVTFFDQCFRPRCGAFLSHLDESSDNPLNSICYMWWDLFPTWGQPNEPRARASDVEVLEVMRQILALDSTACRESALHGLGHWSLNYPDQVAAIIDAFLAAQVQLRPDLKRYALSARGGCIL